MDNHCHLLVRTTENPLSQLMRPLNSGYARWFNRKHDRRGYLFQDRFRSIVCQDQEYAQQLIRYIHLNPIRGGQVTSLEGLAAWKWCGHGHLLGVKGAAGRGFQDRVEALRRFGSPEDQAIQNYLQFLSDGINVQYPGESGMPDTTEQREIAGAGKGWPAVIGDAEFARSAMARHEELRRRRLHRSPDYRPVLEDLAVQVCRAHSIDRGELLVRGRKGVRSAARARFCFRAHEEELIPFAAIARFLGITIPSVTSLCRLGKDRPSRGP